VSSPSWRIPLRAVSLPACGCKESIGGRCRVLPVCLLARSLTHSLHSSSVAPTKRGESHVQEEASQKDGQQSVGQPRSEFQEPPREATEEVRRDSDGRFFGILRQPDRVLVRDQEDPSRGVQDQEQSNDQGDDAGRRGRTNRSFHADDAVRVRVRVRSAGVAAAAAAAVAAAAATAVGHGWEQSW